MAHGISSAEGIGTAIPKEIAKAAAPMAKKAAVQIFAAVLLQPAWLRRVSDVVFKGSVMYGLKE